MLNWNIDSWFLVRYRNASEQQVATFSQIAFTESSWILCFKTQIFGHLFQFISSQVWEQNNCSGVSRTQTSKLELFATIVKGWKPRTIFAKSSVLMFDRVLNTNTLLHCSETNRYIVYRTDLFLKMVGTILCFTKSKRENEILNELTHTLPILDFCTPWKRHKTEGFLTFSGGTEM